MHGHEQSHGVGIPGMALAECRGGRIVVTMRGEHDVATARFLRATMSGVLVLGDADVVLDLSLVSFMDASTVGAVAWVRRELQRRERRLSVRDPSACARRVLDLVGLGDLIEVDDDDLAFIAAARLLARCARPSFSGWDHDPGHPVRGSLSLCAAPPPD